VWKVSAVMARRRIHFAPPSLRCPHCGGQARDLFYHSTYRTRDGPRRLWQCGGCGRWLSERRGTAFFNLKTPEAEVCRSLDAMLKGETPAMRHGLTDHVWSVAEVLGYRSAVP